MKATQEKKREDENGSKEKGKIRMKWKSKQRKVLKKMNGNGLKKVWKISAK